MSSILCAKTKQLQVIEYTETGNMWMKMKIGISVKKNLRYVTICPKIAEIGYTDTPLGK